MSFDNDFSDFDDFDFYDSLDNSCRADSLSALDKFDSISPSLSRPKKAKLGNFTSDTVEIEVGQRTDSKPEGSFPLPNEQQFFFPRSATSTNPIIFQPKHFFLDEVEITPCLISHTAVDLLKVLSDGNGKKCDFTPGPYIGSFSYTKPNKKHFSYYYWWRDNYKKGIKLETDASYVFLFQFELLFSSTDEDKEENLRILISLNQDYGIHTFGVYDSEINTIIYFCLINNLPIPEEITARFEKEKSVNSVIKNETTELQKVLCSSSLEQALYNYCATYDWKSSSQYNDKTKNFFDEHMPKALYYCLKELCKNDKRFAKGKQSNFNFKLMNFTYGFAFRYYEFPRVLIKASFSAFNKKNIDIIYNLQRYAENKIREYFNINHKLRPILDEHEIGKFYIDEYFKPLIQKSDFIPKKEEPEYLKKYDVSNNKLTISSALQIEENAWEIAEKMTVSFDEEQTQIKEDPKVFKKEENQDFNKDTLKLLLAGDKLDAYSKEHNLLIDAVIEKVNEDMYDLLGDICIETDEFGYPKIIEDYRTNIEEYLNGK